MGSTPAAAQKRTNSATEVTASFSITRPRWIFTVFSAIPSAGDLLVQRPGEHAAQDLHFAGRECFQSLSDGPDFGPLADDGLVASQGLVNGLEEDLVVHGFRQKIDRALFHGADAQGDAAVAREEDDGQVATVLRKPRLEIRAAEPLHADVKNDATDAVIRLRSR